MDIGLYVHVPFCATKCGYCDFYSHVPEPGAFAPPAVAPDTAATASDTSATASGRAATVRERKTSPFDPFVDALLAELDLRLSRADLRVRTIFVGGGTPSLLPLRALERLFGRLGGIALTHGAAEVTVEVNPASLTDAKARLLRDHGVTRISMGAQSFFAHELRMLDRLHGPDDIPRGAEIVHRTGFPHFNLDLIFGIPGQDRASWAASLRRAVALGPDHLACYGLTYEPDTPLRAGLDAGLIRPADEEDEAGLYEYLLDWLPAQGFAQYEISNFARPGGPCQHNLRYWRNEPVVSVGPSAAGYLDGERWRNVPDTAEYVRRMQARQDPVIERERLDPPARAGEVAMLGLRLVEGLERRRFRQVTGFDVDDLYGEVIARHVADGLLRADGDRVALTRRGMLVADAVIADFVSPERPAATARTGA